MIEAARDRDVLLKGVEAGLCRAAGVPILADRARTELARDGRLLFLRRGVEDPQRAVRGAGGQARDVGVAMLFEERQRVSRQVRLQLDRVLVHDGFLVLVVSYTE